MICKLCRDSIRMPFGELVLCPECDAYPLEQMFAAAKEEEK